MSTRKDWTIDRGTTWRFSFQWGVLEGDTKTAYDLTGAKVTLCLTEPVPYSTGYDQYDCEVDDQNFIHLYLSNVSTEKLPSRVEYYVRVEFPNGDVMHPLEGTLYVNHRGRYDY